MSIIIKLLEVKIVKDDIIKLNQKNIKKNWRAISCENILTAFPDQGDNMFPLQGVHNGAVTEYSLDNSPHKYDTALYIIWLIATCHRFQLLVFYPGDFTDQATELLTHFSKARDSLLASDCEVSIKED